MVNNMQVNITKMDNLGRGIGYLDGKIIFVDNALPDEIVDVDIISDTKKYCVGKINDIIKRSDKRVESKCIYSNLCGGCNLRNMSYEESLLYKENRVKDVLKKYASIECNTKVIDVSKENNYRNKVVLHVKDGIVGFYMVNSHDIISIDKCLNVDDAINSFIEDIYVLNINNGEITVRCNYNGELLVVINSKDEISINVDELKKKHKIVGIVLNDEVIYGSNYFIDRVNDMFFRISYDAFFQVNREVCAKLFNIISENISEKDVVYDMCSGVGTLSLVASINAKNVYGVEIVQNAIKDSLINAKMNKRDNVKFILGDAFSSINKINDEINTIIVDPPRSGLNDLGVKSIIDSNAKKVIYVSCNPITLARDLKELKKKYDLKEVFVLDMFPYTYHCESIVLLDLK